MQGYLVTKQITWVGNSYLGPNREYILPGTVYLPNARIKLCSNKEPKTITLSELSALKDFGKNKLEDIEVDDCKVQKLLGILKEKAGLPDKLETAINDILKTKK